MNGGIAKRARASIGMLLQSALALPPGYSDAKYTRASAETYFCGKTQQLCTKDTISAKQYDIIKKAINPEAKQCDIIKKQLTQKDDSGD